MQIPLILKNEQEFYIIELQGTIETNTDEIGQLEFINDTPYIQIGHHRLTGSMINLTKPLAIMSKEEDSYNVVSVVNKKIIFKTRPEHILSDSLIGLNTFKKR